MSNNATWLGLMDRSKQRKDYEKQEAGENCEKFQWKELDEYNLCKKG